MLQLEITARLSMSLNNTPLQGAHINVVSGNFIIAQPLGVDDGVDYCHSGRIRRIDEEAIHRQPRQRRHCPDGAGRGVGHRREL